MNPLDQTANKAWLAALLAALASFTATIQARTDLDAMRAVDWVIIVLSALVVGVSTYTVKNKTTTEPQVNDVTYQAEQADVDLREEE